MSKILKKLDYFRTRKEICIFSGEVISVYEEIPSPIDYMISWLTVIGVVSAVVFLIVCFCSLG